VVYGKKKNEIGIKMTLIAIHKPLWNG